MTMARRGAARLEAIVADSRIRAFSGPEHAVPTSHASSRGLGLFGASLGLRQPEGKACILRLLAEMQPLDLLGVLRVAIAADMSFSVGDRQTTRAERGGVPADTAKTGEGDVRRSGSRPSREPKDARSAGHLE